MSAGVRVTFAVMLMGIGACPAKRQPVGTCDPVQACEVLKGQTFVVRDDCSGLDCPSMSINEDGSSVAWMNRRTVRMGKLVCSRLSVRVAAYQTFIPIELDGTCKAFELDGETYVLRPKPPTSTK
jgi:hypothetical protein